MPHHSLLVWIGYHPPIWPVAGHSFGRVNTCSCCGHTNHWYNSVSGVDGTASAARAWLPCKVAIRGSTLACSVNMGSHCPQGVALSPLAIGPGCLSLAGQWTAVLVRWHSRWEEETAASSCMTGFVFSGCQTYMYFQSFHTLADVAYVVVYLQYKMFFARVTSTCSPTRIQIQQLYTALCNMDRHRLERNVLGRLWPNIYGKIAKPYKQVKLIFWRLLAHMDQACQFLTLTDLILLYLLRAFTSKSSRSMENITIFYMQCDYEHDECTQLVPRNHYWDYSWETWIQFDKWSHLIPELRDFEHVGEATNLFYRFYAQQLPWFFRDRHPQARHQRPQVTGKVF